MRIKNSFVVMIFIMIYELGLTAANAIGGPGYNQGGMMGGYNSSNFSFFILGMISFWLVLDAILAYIVYKDAIKHNSTTAIFWAFIVFLTSLIGVLAYLLLRGTSNNMVLAINSSNSSSNLTSTNQTQPIQVQNTKRKFCSICGTQIDSFSKYCQNCGASTD